ncbi:hypothetical protein [Clostridium beijerinckii]|uniref:hypothetical protein n=1 Tax=Clostridium beijerinckii TaxID=1520 RepID=UPI0003D38CAF|nr:hypothetical protein [Clostridium beijerinckii]ALB48008.1 hypothetical protein X276_23420 [Clostridium beijerinckii NRRL B-598]
MNYVIIAICIIAVLMIGVVVFMKMRKPTDSQEFSVIETKNEVISSSMDDYSANEMIVMVDQLPVESIEDESMLTEITDSKVLAHVNNLVPGLLQAGNAANNAVQANGQVLYQAIIPAGAKLANSKDMTEAVRGIYHGAGGINGHANLVAVNQSGAVAANVAASAMGVASMVVGQYYMTQINAELTEISDGISKIADFQDNEYKSKVFALTAQVKKIASFQVEILENQELREAEISRLNYLEQECIELLGQANLTIAGFAKKGDLDYEQYIKEMIEVQNWYIYQKTLLETLYKISDLKHMLHLGSVSRKQCNALLPTYTRQVQDVQQFLTSWHDSTTKKLGIETSTARRKRDGFDGIIHLVPGLFNDDLKFRSISDRTVSMIETQSAGYATERKATALDLFQEDVRLIAKDGKVYYLPRKEE